MRSRCAEVATIAAVLVTIACPAHAETIAPTPLPRNGVSRSFPVAAGVELVHRQQSQDGRRETAESSKTLDVVIEASVLFGKDSDVLGPGAAIALDDLARQMSGKRGMTRLDVIGFTDDLGSDAHGLDLSRRRAARVASHLRPRIPAAIRLAEEGRGEAQPRVPNSSEANRAKNRRVELRLR